VQNKQIEAHIRHEDGYCSLICQIIWQPTLSETDRKAYLAKLSQEFERIMQGKR